MNGCLPRTCIAMRSYGANTRTPKPERKKDVHDNMPQNEGNKGRKTGALGSFNGRTSSKFVQALRPSLHHLLRTDRPATISPLDRGPARSQGRSLTRSSWRPSFGRSRERRSGRRRPESASSRLGPKSFGRAGFSAGFICQRALLGATTRFFLTFTLIHL